MTVQTSNLGFPRIGAHRELKKALESYWNKNASAQELLLTASTLRRKHWQLQKQAGIDFIPSNDFSLYDPVLDMMILLGAVPERYLSWQGSQDPLTRYFAMARGLQNKTLGIDLPALEMTKWFDTNYHYLVPELEIDQQFQLNPQKILNEVREAKSMGIETRPVLLGPLSFLLLSKLDRSFVSGASTLDLLSSILPLYQELFQLLVGEGVAWVQIDEPCLVLELDDRIRKAYEAAFGQMNVWSARPQILVATYFGSLAENSAWALRLPCEAFHLDLVRAPEQLELALPLLPASRVLSLGLVDGRNIWKTDLDRARELVQKAVQALGADRVWVGPSCSLAHVPVDLELETELDSDLKSWLAFAVQKLAEIEDLAKNEGVADPMGNRAALISRKKSVKINDRVTQSRVAGITPAMLSRAFPYSVRAERQQRKLRFPLFPTTTIGSFPQTDEVRKHRANWRSGKITEAQYNEFLKDETRRCIRRQEEIGLEVLVHGEFERTDMVEYFGEKLAGFAFTKNGWVQSYGSRCVKPPIIFGDVYRPRPMTVEWTAFAQSLTDRPVKGMLTGPVTILQWSFVRDDQPRSTTCMQIGLALRDEVRDLESAGITVIQVDEPAIREGLPLRHSDWKAYLRWAVDAFRLATSGVRIDTQIHTHMCYSEFGDILASIAEMDADVLSIETSRSRMELLRDFAEFRYPNDVGPGVYDIHSPRVPSSSEMKDLITRALEVVPVRNLWINPDCGLKTRGWPEVQTALENMVSAAKSLREEAAQSL